MNADQLEKRLGELAPNLRRLLSTGSGEAVLNLSRDDLVETSWTLKKVGFDRLVMVTAVDYIDRVVLVYRLQSRSLSSKLVIKTTLVEGDLRVPSLFGIWPAADWQEREVYDLFGVEFTGHPDLRRIFLPDDFEGHPLRKNYDDPRLIRRPDYI